MRRLTARVPFLQALITTVSQTLGGFGEAHATTFEELEIVFAPASVCRTNHLLARTVNHELRFERMSALLPAETAPLLFFGRSTGVSLTSTTTTSNWQSLSRSFFLPGK